MTIKTPLVAAALVASLGLPLTACGVGPDESREDASDVGHVDKTPPDVVTFNNHYPNVETKCAPGGFRLFVTTHDSAVGRNVIVVADPGCPGYTGAERSNAGQG